MKLDQLVARIDALVASGKLDTSVVEVAKANKAYCFEIFQGKDLENRDSEVLFLRNDKEMTTPL